MQPAVTLLFLVCVHSAKGQGDFWWLGTQAFGGQAGNNGVERVKNDDQGSKATTQCAEGLSCVPKSLCSSSSIPGIQERVSNLLPCRPGHVCCSTEAQSVSTPPSTIPAQAIPFQDLPQTECPSQMECVKDQFCDKSGSISPVRVQLTKQDKAKRGELIPCINAATSLFEVCCKKKNTFTKSENLPSKTISSLQQSPCPSINTLPPVSSCAGQTSSCYNVGQVDADCGGGICCFQGCVNVCSKVQKVFKTEKGKLSQNPIKKTKQPTQSNKKKQNSKTANNKFKHPQVQCPSAMQCVPKSNCNFSGVITRETVILTQLQEEWRVPLAPCVNLRQSETVHVCCRE
eukprot:TRINITY_DN40626_c0_g1_i8.p1 TRINITY_DN40626_c0_g1~~TRINITY_DN40626_c0_g1_i8.p1  ORF type:complete len:344 (-),score=89.29 TRINITY_DN40626_c0_g1_i8:29-1060(-)